MSSSLAVTPSKSIKKGQMWKLGNHRLVCGDASNPDNVVRLIGHDKVSLLLTDPPYGVAYVEDKRGFLNVIHKANKNIEKFDAIRGDQMEQDYYAFSKSWLEPIKTHLASKNSFYVFSGDTKLREFLNAIHDAGYYKSELLIWVKNNIVVGRKDFHPQHELIIYGWFGTHAYFGSKDKSVFFCNKPQSSKLHPTMKPPALLRKIIYHATKPNDIVYDPFGGSGSTLMASEHLGRRCFMIEVDEKYCSVIIERWEKLTGQKAEKL